MEGSVLLENYLTEKSTCLVIKSKTFKLLMQIKALFIR